MDSFGAGQSRRHSSDIWNSFINRSFPQIRVIIFTLFASRCIDDQIDLSVHHGIIDIGTALLEFLQCFAWNAVFIEVTGASFCRNNFKSQLMKLSGYGKSVGTVFFVYADKSSSAQRKLGICSFFRLVIGHSEGFSQTQNFSCGTHFRPKKRVYLREHIKWEDGFLNSIVRMLFFFVFCYIRTSAGKFVGH